MIKLFNMRSMWSLFKYPWLSLQPLLCEFMFHIYWRNSSERFGVFINSKKKETNSLPDERFKWRRAEGEGDFHASGLIVWTVCALQIWLKRSKQGVLECVDHCKYILYLYWNIHINKLIKGQTRWKKPWYGWWRFPYKSVWIFKCTH